MSTRPPKLQVLIGNVETLGLSIPTELDEKLSTDPVRMQDWKSLKAEHERLFPKSRSTDLAAGAESGDADFSWGSSFPQRFKSMDEIEKSGMEVVFRITGWTADVSYIFLAEKPTGETDNDRDADRQEKLKRAHIYAVSNKDGLEVLNDKFVFAYGPGDWLMGLAAEKALGQAGGRCGGHRLQSVVCVRVLEPNREI